VVLKTGNGTVSIYGITLPRHNDKPDTSVPYLQLADYQVINLHFMHVMKIVKSDENSGEQFFYDNLLPFSSVKSHKKHRVQ
jgi:hypothetical protein